LARRSPVSLAGASQYQPATSARDAIQAAFLSESSLNGVAIEDLHVLKLKPFAVLLAPADELAKHSFNRTLHYAP